MTTFVSVLRFLLPIACTASFVTASASGQSEPLRFDFGRGEPAEGHRKITEKTGYSEERGYGWTLGEDRLDARDRGQPAAPLNDFVFGRAPAVFRVDLPAGTYRMTLQLGDTGYSDHILAPSISIEGLKLPDLRPSGRDFVTLTVAFELEDDHVKLICDSPVNNWILNALQIEPAGKAEPPHVSRSPAEVAMDNLWEDVEGIPFPAARHLETFREHLKEDPKMEPTGLDEEDYLKLIEGNVDFFRQHQDGRGAIIDPYLEREYQYATPCYALSAAALVAHAGRDDLVDSAALAMDWSVRSLARREAATAHEDFYAPVLAHALTLLEARVQEPRAHHWREQLAGFDPWSVYRSGPGGGNWNVVSASGEALFHLLGIRDDVSYIEASLAAQGRFFRSPWGLYLEGPMPYDHFPRLWAADLLAAGYEGEFTAPLEEVIGRAAITSLFLQSPTGELPTGGRSAHHQWNEAEQAVTFEIYGARAAAEEDEELAGVYKRAARLALSSMKRWQRPSGEMWIVKNRVDPAKRHGYEGYSSHSQYNLLAMSMLAIAHKHALATRGIQERPAPADVGGFLIDLRPGLPHLVANAGGTYVQINTAPDHNFNPAGLIRIHQAGYNPQLGPSDGLVRKALFHQPAGERTTASVGVAWKDEDGNWRRLAEESPASIREAALHDVVEEAGRVSFRLEWAGEFPGIERVVEEYTLTPDGVRLAVNVPGYEGPLRLVWPVLADDGERQPDISVAGDAVTVALEGDQRKFSVRGADRVWVEDELYADHNGWARLACAEFSKGGTITLETAFSKE